MNNPDQAWEAERACMVRDLVAYHITDERVLSAMAKIRRHLFLPAAHRNHDAYRDHPVPIGHGQTISQPFIVAYMTARLNPQPGEKILEIGAGSGYQSAILAELGAKVFSLERIPSLAAHAAAILCAEGYSNVRVRCADGFDGWTGEAPFDAIIGTCAPETIPVKLTEQLKEQGRLLLPIGPVDDQRLVMIRKSGDRIACEDDIPVRFVPMIAGI